MSERGKAALLSERNPNLAAHWWAVGGEVSWGETADFPTRDGDTPRSM